MSEDMWIYDEIPIKNVKELLQFGWSMIFYLALALVLSEVIVSFAEKETEKIWNGEV